MAKKKLQPDTQAVLNVVKSLNLPTHEEQLKRKAELDRIFNPPKRKEGSKRNKES